MSFNDAASHLMQKLLDFSLSWGFLLSSVSVSALLVFSPSGLRCRLGLESFFAMFQPFISLVLLMSSVCLFWRILLCIGAKAKNLIASGVKRLKRRRAIKADLETLTDAEIFMLLYIYKSNSGSVWVPLESAIVNSLLRKGFIYQTSDITTLPSKNELPPLSPFAYTLCILVAIKHDIIPHVSRFARKSGDKSKLD